MTSLAITPLFASGALQFAFEKATIEGKLTIGALVVVSLFSWSVIITKVIQLWRAGRASKQFFDAYHQTREQMDLHRKGQQFDGAPAYELYTAGQEELQFQLTKHPVVIRGESKITQAGFDSVRVALEEAAMHEALALEKGMIVLSTAVAGGPFIGLLGTVWGVMETFSGIARANAASLTAMAPGVAGALIATVIGLLVAIPAMFAYNFMVTKIRAFTQELDAFAIRYATQIEHSYVDSRPIGEEVSEAITRAIRREGYDANTIVQAAHI
ncbi:MAG TPA: MotA/TolQ/ExbB proton channel family protein [Verrucomicrobiae bacterium]|nr:MotA/TolQ/ExbB proton channel family protein [Verrucomicrobiae bacterium]